MYNYGNEDLGRNYWEIEEAKSQINQESPKLDIDFYYMERSYDYIENFYYYVTDEELLDEVMKANKDNKWLIFVSSKRKGRALIDKIKEKMEELEQTSDKISTIFLSAESKFLSDKPTEDEKREKATYEKLVNDQSFDEDVLITTSVLDNGVNIRAESIKNVVIDYCDRTEFIQMLGRLRTTPITKINLYIPKYSEEKIHKRLYRNIKSLVDRLIFDFADLKFKKSKFDKQLHRYTAAADSFATYNSNAIWQLIDTINFQMSLMRVRDPQFNLDTLIDVLDLKAPLDFYSDCRKIYNYYMQEGRSKLWSRNIVDILTTKDDIEQRDKWTAEDENRNEWENRYDFKFDDTFTKYLFEVLIPDYFEKIIGKKIQKIIGRLNNEEQNQYQHFKAQTSNNKILTNYEELQDLQRFVKRFGLGISTDEEKTLYEKQQYYRGLVTSELLADRSFEDMLLNEQMKWIEKSIADCQPISTDDCNDYQRYVVKRAIEEDKLKAYQTGKYYDASLLEHCGIPHNEKGEPTSKEKEFCEKYRGGKIFNRSDLNKPIPIDDSISEGYEYGLRSCNSNGVEHQTYYVFVKKKE